MNASYQLQFYGPTVDCQAANSSVAAIIDNKANELPTLHRSVETLNTYFAFVPYMSDSGYEAILSNRLKQRTNGSNQLWMRFSRYVINSTGQQNPEPQYLVCQLYNASYNISLEFVDGHQTITNNSLLTLNAVDYPQANLNAPSDLVQYAYSAVMRAFTDLFIGSMGFYNDKSFNTLSFTFRKINTPILDTSLMGTSDLDITFDRYQALHSSTDGHKISGQRLQDIQLARNQTLDVLIPELAYNITLSFMSDSLLSPSIITNVTTQDSVNLYAYHCTNLLLSYGFAIFFAPVANILAAFTCLDNGVSNDKVFFSIPSSSRTPGPTKRLLRAQLPLPLEVSEARPKLDRASDGGFGFTIVNKSIVDGFFHRRVDGLQFKHDQLIILPARLLLVFRRIIRPSLAPGYIRINWTCGCGREMYADVKEMKIGAAKRLQSTLRRSAMMAVAAAEAGPTSGNQPSPTVPRSALLRPSNTQQGHNTNQRASNDAARAGISATPSTANFEDTTSTSVAQSSRDQMHLLLCIITSRSTYLAQLNVTTFTNDQYLFKGIVDEYQQIRMAEAWYCKIPKTNWFQIPRWFSSFFGDLHLFVPKAANFVKFRLVPCGTTFRPWGFTFQSLPPPEEAQVNRNWDYNPCPQDIDDMCLDEQLIHSLLEPNKPHLDRYWLNCFPKKLKGELRYEPGKAAIGWGIHIAEGPNWAVISWLALLIVVSSGLLAVLYSIFKNDVSSAFTIAAWVVAIQGLMVTHLQLKN